uniref:Uncharacterized protein n=1 Tax=Magallana gigas TaxID=29159 RepID=K1S6N7_MAGGI
MKAKIEQVQRKRKSLDCIPVYACVETTEQGKPKRKKTAIRGKHNKAMVTQGSNHLTSQQLDTSMEMVPLPSPPSPYCDGIIESDYVDLQVEKSKSAGKKRQATETVTKRISSKGAIVTQEWDGQDLQQSEPFKNIIEPLGSSIDDSQGDQSNMAIINAPNSEPPFPECLSDVVPETAQYQLNSIPN